jgi:hypothetical protein
VGFQPGPCANFSSPAARNWCSDRPGKDLLNCTDFPSVPEATYFTKTYDPQDINKLDPNTNAQSCDEGSR